MEVSRLYIEWKITKYKRLELFQLKSVPTKRAPDPSTSSGQAVWESARFTGIFLASGFSCSQTESTPAHTQVTQTVSPLLLTIKDLSAKETIKKNDQ